LIATILLPLDGSELKDAILPHVIELARRFQARVVLVHALPSVAAMLIQPGVVLGTGPDAAASAEIAAESVAAARQSAERLVAEVAAALEREGIESEAELREGDPAGVILAVATEKNADLIAMATHGRSGLGRLLLGSVADEVVRNPPHLPVLLIRTEE
jgi:nucleotide-binding universal stress UspA family protein